MIKVEPRRAPKGFNTNVRDPGQAWLAKNAHLQPKRPVDYWNKWADCRHALARAFSHRCGYTACWLSSGQVEHFVSWYQCKQIGQRHLAYEWKNYRWIHPQLNGRKGTKDILDPFEVEDDWFEINLFSLELKLTSKVPAHLRSKAQLTVEELGLDKSSLVIDLRNEALQRYREGTPLEGIERYSPLMARALRRLIEAETDSLTAPERRLRRRLEQEHSAHLANLR